MIAARGSRLAGSANAAHLVLAPADVAWKSCDLRMVVCDPRWVPNPAQQSRFGRALLLRVSRESEVAANETRGAGGASVSRDARLTELQREEPHWWGCVAATFERRDLR